MCGSFSVGMALPMYVSYAGLSLFIFKAGFILLRFMRIYAYNLTQYARSECKFRKSSSSLFILYLLQLYQVRIYITTPRPHRDLLVSIFNICVNFGQNSIKLFRNSEKNMSLDSNIFKSF